MTRYMGTETEYGITTPDDPSISQLLTSTHAVVAYAAMNTAARSRWSYEEEAPLKDTRGFDLQRYRTVPVVDANAMGVANVVTTNGARYYVDHGHPEYSSPEVSNAWDAMIYDAAGDYVLNKSATDIRELWDQQISVLDKIDPCPPLKFYKNNVDGKGQSYGSHENYQYSRKTDFARLTQALIPFFVTRQVIIGAGRMGIGQESEREGFQISQVSHDPTCTHELLLADGRRLTAIDILRIYRERAAALPELDEVDTKVLALWGEILDDLERDPLSTADRLDWTAKWSLIRRYLDRGVDIADPKLKLIDIQYADIDPAKSLYHALVRKGKMRTLVDEETIKRAVTEPPTDSRAYFRGRVSEKFGEDIVASSWQSVIFSVNNQPHRLPMDKVDGFTKEEIGELVERAEDITALMKGLGFKHV